MDNAPLTDADLEALSKLAVVNSYASYQSTIPVLIAEILRLRQVVRDLSIEQATRDAAQ